MSDDKKKELQSILNKHKICSGSWSGNIMDAMTEAYKLGIAYTLSPKMTTTGGDWQIGELLTESPGFVPYQLCPKCNGQGILSKPPYIAGDVNQWSSSSTSFTCDVCNGSKILPMFIQHPC